MTFAIHAVPIVLDASVAVAIAAEADGDLAGPWAHWISDPDRVLLTPPIFWLEVANALLRRRRLPGAEVDGILGDLVDSGIEVADRGVHGVRAAIRLAARHGLSVCDASYLWLTIDVGGELATRDRALVRAAQAEGVALALD